jgi:hypothetical protein
MNRIRLFGIVFAVFLIAGCAPAAPVATEPQVASVNAPSEPSIPAGWATHSSQKCEYSISTPAEMVVTEQSPYNRLFAFKPASPDAGNPNFVYVSVVTPEIQDRAKAGVYEHEVYNYDPAATDVLLGMQVGESKSVHADVSMTEGFTFQRLPDATLDGQAVRAYVNAAPWEFPRGTKEMRYYASVNGCTYIVGGYMDTTGTGQAGSMTEALFQQVLSTVKLMP